MSCDDENLNALNSDAGANPGDAGPDVGGTATDGGPDAGPGGDGGLADAGTKPPDGGALPDGGGAQNDGGALVCGGLAPPCPDPNATFCDYQRNQCGFFDGSGWCRPRPIVCTDDVEPVCACNRAIFTNECQANQAGFDVRLGGCGDLADHFACGYRYCALDTAYCRRNEPRDMSQPITFECQPLPAACGGNQDCACLTGEPCSDMCQVLSNGGAEITCRNG